MLKRMTEQSVQLAEDRLPDLVWRTASIELTDVTVDETLAVMNGAVLPSGSLRGRVIANLLRAWHYLLEHAGDPVDWQYVKEYNQLAAATVADNPGRLRTAPVSPDGRRVCPRWKQYSEH